MEIAFRALLTGSAAVTALAPASQINFGTHPQGKPFPAIVLNLVSDAGGHTLTGVDGLSNGRVQVDCYADDYGAAKTLSHAVRAVLDAYSGGGFSGIFHTATRDGREGGTNEADRPFRVSLDFLTHWRT